MEEKKAKEKMEQIRKEISDYHYSLDQKFGGNLAAIAMTRIEAIMGQPWSDGKEKKGRGRGGLGRHG